MEGVPHSSFPLSKHRVSAVTWRNIEGPERVSAELKARSHAASQVTLKLSLGVPVGRNLSVVRASRLGSWNGPLEHYTGADIVSDRAQQQILGQHGTLRLGEVWQILAG